MAGTRVGKGLNKRVIASFGLSLKVDCFHRQTLKKNFRKKRALSHNGISLHARDVGQYTKFCYALVKVEDFLSLLINPIFF